VHYQRTAADYDGWGLFLFGDVDASETTTWPANRPFRGEDEYGRFTWVKLAPGASNVGLIVQRNGTKDVEADRFVNPRQTPEIWLKEGDPTIYTSQAAAQGFVTVHYRRPAGDYADWGCTSGVTPSRTAWARTGPPRASVTAWTDYGAFFRVPIKDAASPVNFIVHTPAATPSRPPASRAATARSCRAATRTSGCRRGRAGPPLAGGRRGRRDLHLHRDDGDYSGWGLHVWAGAATPTDWTTPILPERIDAFGAVFRVPLAAGATSLSYIIHKGDTKDLPDDQALDLVAVGHEVWILSGRPGYLLPVLGGGGTGRRAGRPRRARAHLIDRTTVVWDVDAVPRTPTRCLRPRRRPHGAADRLGGGRVIRLLPKAGRPDAGAAAAVARTWRPAGLHGRSARPRPRPRGPEGTAGRSSSGPRRRPPRPPPACRSRARSTTCTPRGGRSGPRSTAAAP
jgi:hypothetical protein